MSKILELKGKNIIDAYDGYKLSDNFGYSCANIHVSYSGFNKYGFGNLKTIKNNSMQGNKMEMFELFTDNPNNISCFVYINDNNEIEGRRMFFKGKQLLDHNLFNIITKKDEEIYYLYGYYGNYSTYKVDIEKEITKKVLNTYKNKTIYTDNGTIINGKNNFGKEYWIMQIEKMDFDVYPPIDFLYQSPQLKCFSNFNPSTKIINWLEYTYDINNVKFGRSYRYSENDDDSIKHWNQKY